MTTLRAQWHVLRAALVAAVAASVIIGGCDDKSQARYETLTLGNGPLVASGGTAGRNSETLFDGPEARAIATAYGRESLPEYSRHDGAMNISDPGPRLATADWPQDPAPDANYVRWVAYPAYSDSSVQLVPVYQRVGQYAPRANIYWHTRGAY